ncbi:hypothetical protein [Synechococcus sp. MU1650]|uniref:hypothetical protein n=1 Tax=Synechococcus sp. MU1650 TaxID=2508352 RepID=UPI001CF8DFE3|nr:hypothetical protein [Synechococcus sp. MU1650]MCB4378788.1 glycosyltransferase family 4 protein [Synechococcus sp. MU1650]
MNFFETNILPFLWKESLSGSISSVLNSELKDYHSYAKIPDTGENFRRFYSHIEPLHYFLANQAFSDFVKTKALSSGYYERINSTYLSAKFDSFFERSKIIVVLKGTIDLAHGDVLQKQLKNVPDQKLDAIGVILIDYSLEQISNIKSKIGNVRIAALNNISSLKDKYSIIAYSLAKDQLKGLNKEVIWWGIPFGMLFTYRLTNLMFEHFVKQNLVTEDMAGRLRKSLLTVKHHHSFTNLVVDNIYTSTPLVSGFLDLYKPKISSFEASFYYKNSLWCSSPLREQEAKIIKSLRIKKAKGCLLFSSVSRIEKTSHVDYISAIYTILSKSSSASLICFGKSLPQEYKNLLETFGVHRIIFVGWLSPAATVKVISLLDLFLDPFPFGAGMTFASAGFQGIPIISTKDFAHISPSSISILYDLYSSGRISIADEILIKNLFDSSQSVSDRCINILNSPKSSKSTLIEMRRIISQVFVESTDTIFKV